MVCIAGAGGTVGSEVLKQLESIHARLWYEMSSGLLRILIAIGDSVIWEEHRLWD